MTLSSTVSALSPVRSDLVVLWSALIVVSRVLSWLWSIVTHPIARILEVSQEYTSQMSAVDASRSSALAYTPHASTPHIPASASQVPLASIPTAIPVLGDDDVVRPVLDMVKARKGTSKTAPRKTARKATTTTAKRTTSKRQTAVKVAANKPVERVDYRSLSRRELQTLAKSRSVKANMTSAAIITALEAQDNGQ